MVQSRAVKKRIKINHYSKYLEKKKEGKKTQPTVWWMSVRAIQSMHMQANGKKR